MSLIAIIAFLLGFNTDVDLISKVREEIRPQTVFFTEHSNKMFIGLYIGGLDLIFVQENNKQFPPEQILCHEIAHREYSRMSQKTRDAICHQYETCDTEAYAQYFTEHWQDCYKRG